MGFDYTAFDIFEAPNTRLMDLNIHFVPPDLQSKFDLVTNYGTTEHVLNQMLAMRSIHDLAKPSGLIHHDLPCGGYYLHCYFKYNPGVFHDLATANGYRVVFQEISSGRWRQTPSALREKGFEDSKFRDYGIEIVFQKTADASFRIPVDNISSAGLGVFMAYIEDVRKNQGDIKLSNMSPKVFNVFDLLGFPLLYDITKDEAEAVQKFTSLKK